ncbi:MAG: hypothetical protein AB1598_05555 [Thermodesulfobacteriota bacterium]
MRRCTESVVCLCALFVLVFAVHPRQATAGPPVSGCSIGITKEAIPPVDLSFNFLTESTADPDHEFSLPAGTSTNEFLVVGETVVITELPLEGWQLIDVECEDGGPGISVSVDEENRVVASCSSQGFSACTFTNQALPNIPTLSEWGMIAAAAGLMLIGIFFTVRRLRASKESDAIG